MNCVVLQTFRRVRHAIRNKIARVIAPACHCSKALPSAARCRVCIQSREQRSREMPAIAGGRGNGFSTWARVVSRIRRVIRVVLSQTRGHCSRASTAPLELRLARSGNVKKIRCDEGKAASIRMPLNIYISGVVCAFTGNEGGDDQGQKTEGTARHVGVRTLEGLLEGFGDTSLSSCAHAFYYTPCRSSAKLY